MDRPWALGRAANEVFITGTDVQGQLIGSVENLFTKSEGPAVGGVWVARSTDGGLTFPQQVLSISNDHLLGLNSNLASGNGNLYLYYEKRVAESRFAHVVAVSKDSGLTWSHKMVAEQPWDSDNCLAYPLMVFPVIAADSTGGVFITWVAANPETHRADLFFAASPDEGEHWSAPVLVTDRPGTRLYPWLATDAQGQVGMAWYESNKTLYPRHVTNTAERASCTWGESEPVDWFLHYASISAPLSQNPQSVETLAQPDPVTRTPFLGRPFAELLQVAFDPQGKAAIAYVSDAEGASARPMFVLQAPSS